MDWTEMELFKGIDLNDSFILNWTIEKNVLCFEIEASIWPESRYYYEPKVNEYTCYRKATLKITKINRITGLKPFEQVVSSTDPDGSKDYGNVDTLSRTENRYELSGDFGLVEIEGGELHFELYT
jgi:hypothetical protein